VRQTLIESLLLALAGGAMGLLGAFVGGTLLAQLRVFGVPLLQTAAMDGTSLAATIALVCTAAALSALLPATQLWRTGASTGLREAGMRGSAGRGSTRMRQGFVVSEIVLACMLVVAAGLLIRSFIGVLQVDMGFEPENALTWRIEEHRSFDSQVDRVAFYERLVDRVASVPGVESAGLGDSLPLSTKRSWSLSVGGVSYDTQVYPQAAVVLIDGSYLRTMRIPLVRGRDFDSRDSAGSAPVMIVNETMAANLWPGQDPIGRTARVNGPECTVVGVVGDVRQGLEETTRPEMYLSLRQRDSYQWNAPRLVVRSTRTPAALVPDVRAALKEVDANLGSNEVTTLEQVVDRAIAPRRLITGLLVFFSSCALLLAALGLYGVIAYSVDQRTREIGVRLALGARRRDVLRLVLEEGLRLTGAGVLAGSAAAFVVMRLVQSQLYGVTATDPTTYGAAAVVLGGAACLASTLPAWRAARTDPAVALRHE
jgi:predicted permease